VHVRNYLDVHCVYRLGDGANVYLASAELASVSALLGKIPTKEEYMEYAKELDTMSADIYRYLNFNEIESYQASAKIGEGKLLDIPVVAA